MLAGSPRKLQDIFLEQLIYLCSLEEQPSIKAVFEQKITEAQHQMKHLHKPNLELLGPETKLPLGASPKYWAYLQNYNQLEELQSLSSPILILQGEKDYQVTMTQDFEIWKKLFEKSKNVKLISYQNLNHLFMSSSGEGLGTPSEYANAKPSFFNETVIDDICNWIHSTLKSNK